MLPTKEGGYTEEERFALLKSAATPTQMRVILDYYIEKGLITKEEIALCFLKNPESEWDDKNGLCTRDFSYYLWGDYYGIDENLVVVTYKNN